MAKKQPASEDKDIPNGEDVVGTGNDARLKMYEQINDANDKALAEEGALADVNDDDTTSEFIPANATDEEITARELDRAEEESGSEVAEEEEPQKYKIKVNGKEEELTMEELIERAQKSQAAEEKFQEAARLRAEADALRKQNIEQPSPKDVADKKREEDRALVRAIQVGTEDEAMAAIEKLRQGNTPSVTTDEVARTIDERLTFNEAVNRFKTEFSDIVSDPVLLDLVLTRDKSLIEQGDRRGYWERYENIGNDVRKWVQEKTKPVTPSAVTQEQTKQQRKASAPAAPKGASQKAPEAVAEEDQDIPTSQVIAEMAKARGGPQFMR